MPDIRACPECGQPQWWCDNPRCSSALIPQGHWTHTSKTAGNCRNLGDMNREPGKPPDNVYTRGWL